MWILPKQLHTLDSVRDTEALNLGLEESSRLCAQSLFVRSKPSPLRTWLQKWKRDSWTQHLYGRILNPSLGRAFETEWTSLLEVTLANHSAQQGSEQERMTQDTCGLGSQTEFGFCDQECASLKMSKDISRWDSPASSATWKSWVTRCRGEYSQRVKSAHPTSASGCSSWPTTTASDWKGCGNAVTRKDGKHRLDKLEAVVMYGPPAPVNPSTTGSRQESWATPIMGDSHLASTPEVAKKRIEEGKVTLSRQNPGKLNPRWVETLMGLPIGWTMPSYTQPVTIAPTNCDCLETESCLPQQSEHLELF